MREEKAANRTLEQQARARAREERKEAQRLHAIARATAPKRASAEKARKRLRDEDHKDDEEIKLLAACKTKKTKKKKYDIDYDTLEWKLERKPYGLLPVRWSNIPAYMKVWFHRFLEGPLQRHGECCIFSGNPMFKFVSLFQGTCKDKKREFKGYQVQLSITGPNSHRCTNVIDTRIGAMIAAAGIMDVRVASPASSASWVLSCMSDIDLFHQWTRSESVAPYEIGVKHIMPIKPGGLRKNISTAGSERLRIIEQGYDHETAIEKLLEKKSKKYSSCVAHSFVVVENEDPAMVSCENEFEDGEVRHLLANGGEPRDIFNMGVSVAQLLRCGATRELLEDEGFTVAELNEEGDSDEDLESVCEDSEDEDVE